MASAVVGKRVCTTDCSVAIVNAMTSLAFAAIGVATSAVIAVIGVDDPTRSIRSTTSDVVPDREITTIRSYERPKRYSDAGNESVSPCPAPSRRAA